MSIGRKWNTQFRYKINNWAHLECRQSLYLQKCQNVSTIFSKKICHEKTNQPIGENRSHNIINGCITTHNSTFRLQQATIIKRKNETNAQLPIKATLNGVQNANSRKSIKAIKTAILIHNRFGMAFNKRRFDNPSGF